jgi:hypothetical protein
MQGFHRFITEDYFDAYIDTTEDFYTFYYINLRMSDAFYNPTVSLDRNEWASKEEITMFNQYFNDLKKFAWNNFYEEFKRIDKQKALKFQAELAILFNNIWVSSTYQYYADKPLDVVAKQSKHDLNYPKIPNLEDADVAIYLNVLRMQHHNYAFIKGKYQPFDYDYFDRNLNNNVSTKDVTTNQDKKSLNEYLIDYKKTQKNIDNFMRIFYEEY